VVLNMELDTTEGGSYESYDAPLTQEPEERICLARVPSARTTLTRLVIDITDSVHSGCASG
jgi:hypothetical protein